MFFLIMKTKTVYLLSQASIPNQLITKIIKQLGEKQSNSTIL